MKRNSTTDLIIVILLSVAISSIPFQLIFKDELVIIAAQILSQVLLYFIRDFYIRKYTNLEQKICSIGFKNFAIILPLFLLCFSNYFSLFFVDKIVQINVDKVTIFSIVLALAIAFNEEIVFRLIFISCLDNESRVKRILISSLIFSLCHLSIVVSSFSLSGFFVLVYTFFLGLILAFIFEYTGSVIPCIALHFLYNSINGVLFSEICFSYRSNTQFLTIYIISNIIVALFVSGYALLLYNKKYKNDF